MLFIVIGISVIKIILGLLFAGGDRNAGWYMIWVFYPLRVIMYYDPWSKYNQPRKSEFDMSDEDQNDDQTSNE